MDLGSPLPSAGEGLEVRGRAHSLGALSILRSSSSAEFRESIQQRVCPSPPNPSPRWGEGSRRLQFVDVSDEPAKYVTIICITQ